VIMVKFEKYFKKEDEKENNAKAEEKK